MSLQVPKVIPNDWTRLRIIVDKLKHLRLGNDSSPTFTGLTLSGLTASRLIVTNASKVLESSDLASWVAQTANQVLVADDGDGTITLSTPQDIATDSYPLFVNTNSALSSMILTGGGISAGTNAGTIKVAALTAMLRTGTGALDNLTRITLAEQDNITLAAVNTYYNVLLTYGTPCTIATSTGSGNGANIIGIGHCLKETDGIRHYANAGLRLTDGVRKLHNRASKLRKIEKSSGALVSETGTRNLYITAGTFHRGINSYDFTLKNTSASDTFDYYYYNPATSAWVKDDNSGSHYTQIDIVQYNKVDSGTGLDNLVANKYTTNWIFVHPDDEHLLVVYGRSNSTLTAAENESIPPSLPDIIGKLAVLLCKIIVRATTGALVFQNIEYFTFTPDITVDHNDLQGLQGGTTDEYYHLTSAEHTLVSAIGGLTPTDSNFIVGNNSTWVTESGATARTSIGLGTGDSPAFTNLYYSGSLIEVKIASCDITVQSNQSGSYVSTSYLKAGDHNVKITTDYDLTEAPTLDTDVGSLGSFSGSGKVWTAVLTITDQNATLTFSNAALVNGAGTGTTINSGATHYADTTAPTIASANFSVTTWRGNDGTVTITVACGESTTGWTGRVNLSTWGKSATASLSHSGNNMVRSFTPTIQNAGPANATAIYVTDRAGNNAGNNNYTSDNQLQTYALRVEEDDMYFPAYSAVSEVLSGAQSFTTDGSDDVVVTWGVADGQFWPTGVLTWTTDYTIDDNNKIHLDETKFADEIAANSLGLMFVVGKEF